MGIVKYRTWTWGKNWSIEVKMRFWGRTECGGGGVTSRLEVPVLGLTLTPGPVGEEPNGPRVTVTHVRLLNNIKSSHCLSSECYCFPLILTPFLFFLSLSFMALLYVAVLYSTFSTPLQRLNYFSLPSSICFPFCTLCVHCMASLLFRIYLCLYFLFFFLFSAFWRSFASLFFFILFRFVPLFVVNFFSSLPCYSSAL
jgi:hypothetical protein